MTIRQGCFVVSFVLPYHKAPMKRKNMNRRKKINQLLKAHAKKASAKLAPKNRNTYISKADRLKLAAEASLGAEQANADSVSPTQH